MIAQVLERVIAGETLGQQEMGELVRALMSGGDCHFVRIAANRQSAYRRNTDRAAD